MNLVDEKDIPRPEEGSTDLAALQVFLSFRLVSGSGLRSLRVWFTGSLVFEFKVLGSVASRTSGFAKPRTHQSYFRLFGSTFQGPIAKNLREPELIQAFPKIARARIRAGSRLFLSGEGPANPTTPSARPGTHTSETNSLESRI